MNKLFRLIILLGLFSFAGMIICCPGSRCSCSGGCSHKSCCSGYSAKNCCSCTNCSKDCCRPYGYIPKGCESVFKKNVTETKLSNKEIIKKEYAKVVTEGSCCCGIVGGCCGGGADLSKYIGYTEEELKTIPEANLGLGCGHPVSLGEIKKGWTVLDLGSGAGIDCFLAAKKVGDSGRVIGVDMTEAMIKKARENAKKYSFTNVEFRLGDIEKMPVDKGSIDIIISNCVINLVDDKYKVFQEAYRVLKPGGKMYVSDVVLLKDLTHVQKKDTKLLCACVAGALLKADYIAKLEKAGFTVKIVSEDTEISKKWFNRTDLPIESMKFIAYKIS